MDSVICSSFVIHISNCFCLLQVEELLARLKRQQAEANTQGKLRMAAITEGAQLQGYAQRLRADLEAMQSQGSDVVQELAAKNKVQVENIRQQVVARHHCVYNFVRGMCTRGQQQFYDGASVTRRAASPSGRTSQVPICIDLSDCLVDDEMVSLVVKAVRESACGSIDELNLSRNIITDRGARRLSMHLQKLGRIQRLDLRDNKITADGE